MKLFIGVLVLFCVAVNAGTVPEVLNGAEEPINYETAFNDILNEMAQVAVQTAETLNHQFEEIVMAPLTEVEEAVQAIEDRKMEDEKCVDNENDTVNEIIDTMHGQMGSCGAEFGKTSASIMIDITKASQQLIFEGRELFLLHKKCQSYNSIIRRKSCRAVWITKGTIYLINARKSIKTIKTATSQRVPQSFHDAQTCTHSSSNKALLELEQVHSNIDQCIAKH